MISRIIKKRLAEHAKSILLLGPRQVGKSTLCMELSPDISINLADQEQLHRHLKDEGLIKRIVGSNESQLILVDEIQRIPNMLNTIQYIIDSDKRKRFILTGSSARKLKRGNANLLPGRVLVMNLSPLMYWELKKDHNLEFLLTKGALPEVYLKDYGKELLDSYVNTYLREEIQAEALTKDLGAYGRFLDLAALKSGEQVNYSKIASDSEINKETIRRYFSILEDTLLIRRIPSFTDIYGKRRAQQKDKFIFFDLGVRNAILGMTYNRFTPDSLGLLFEQWVVLQLIYFNEAFRKNWKVSTFRTDQGDEVDVIIETQDKLLAIEIKYGMSLKHRMCKGLNTFASLVKGRNIEKYILYRGAEKQFFECGTIGINYAEFFDSL